MFVRNLLLGALAAALMISAPGAFAEMKAPAAEVEAAVEEVLGLLRDESLQSDQRHEMLREAIAPHFDFVVMSRSILAAAWKKATPEQQQRFVGLFKKLLENTYITAMEEYTGQSVRYGKEKVNGKLATVETFIVRTSGVETPVLYRLRINGDRWLAYDVAVEGVSLVNNYRSSFGTIVRKDGMNGLNDQLDEKLNTGN